MILNETKTKIQDSFQMDEEISHLGNHHRYGFIAAKQGHSDRVHVFQTNCYSEAYKQGYADGEQWLAEEELREILDREL